MHQVFNSFSQSIPPLRYDLQRYTAHSNGETVVAFYDQMGYATPNFALPADSESLLSLIDGNRSIDDIMHFCTPDITKHDVLRYVQFLDKHALLESTSFRHKSAELEHQYEQHTTHATSLTDGAVPNSAEEVTTWLDDAFRTYPTLTPHHKAIALYAPHIDPRVGMKSYVRAFSAVRHLKPKRVVILGTSHYSGWYQDLYKEHPFIFSGKSFHLPNGIAPSIGQEQLLNALNQPVKHANTPPSFDARQAGLSLHDRAFRVEHSIDIHALFLNHIWSHPFEIIPILVGNLDEILYQRDGYTGKQLQSFAEAMRRAFPPSKDTFYLISGDLSHVGKKFGDDRPAHTFFDDVEAFDLQFLNAAADSSRELHSVMQSNYDAFRICGFPPLMAFKTMFPSIRGTVLGRELWDERDRESAVSYGSILFEE